MEVVVVTDNLDGKCWSTRRQWGPDNASFILCADWKNLAEECRSSQATLIVFNLEVINNFDTFLQQELESACNSTPLTTVFVSQYTEKLEAVSALQFSSLGCCYSDHNLQNLKSQVSQAISLSVLVRANSELANKYQVLLESASEGILQFDSEGIIEEANPKAQKLLQYHNQSLLGMEITDLLSTTDDDDNTDSALTEIREKILSEVPYSTNRGYFKTAKDTTIVAEISSNAIQNLNQSETKHLLVFQDITARTLNEQRLIKLTKYDVLTGLSNRAKFHDFTEGKIAYCKHNGKSLALLFIDIDHFKNINDSMGHDAGDDLLVGVAERLRNCIRETDLLARIGGDEFAITLLEMGSPNQVTRIVQKIVESLSTPFYIQSNEINVSVSVGISLYPESGRDIKTLTKTADTAVHQAKADGRNTYRFFSEEIQNRVMEQHSLELALKRAIANEEFTLHYQPLIDTVSGRITGLEALIRWQHEDWPNIGPHRFIPVAEESGLLPSLGKWVLYTACKQSVEWLNDEDIKFNYPISVNLSPKQLIHNDFLNLLADALQDTGVPPENLVLELTETAMMQDPEAAISILDEINKSGVKLAVDDFGTGYSSLNYLKKLPISKLKIDRSFVNDIGVDESGEAIVKAILALAHSLNLEAVGEGVEEQSQVDFLRGHECELLQGYFFSKPLPVEEISELLRQEKLKWQPQLPEVNQLNGSKHLNGKRPLH